MTHLASSVARPRRGRCGLGACALLLGLLVAAGPARADAVDQVVGRFEVKYEEVTSNCENTGMALLRGVVAIERRKGQTVSVDIERLPRMSGSAARGGRLKATSKQGPTSIQGLDGKFSIAGSVNDDGVLQMVLVAEYYLKRRPYCTQSWNVTGVRAGDAPRAKPTSDEPAVDAAVSEPWAARTRGPAARPAPMP